MPIKDRYRWGKLANTRKTAAALAAEPCCLCGKPIDYTRGYWLTDQRGRRTVNPWAVTVEHHDHRALGGAELPDPHRLGVAHAYCQQVQGQWLRRVAKSRQLGLPDPPKPKYTGPRGPRAAISSRRNRKTLRRSFLHTPPEFAGADSSYADASTWDVPWLRDLLAARPDDAMLPRLMTVPHPDAVGSYGAEQVSWMRREFGMVYRWWQVLAATRQLEHDREGRLVWQEVVESTSRRAGKSVRVRGQAMWRIQQADRFGEPQLVMFTGKDLPICKEIHRRSWPWALRRADQGVILRRTNGQEELELGDGSRWMVRSQDSVYGYDVTQGDVDEAWAVPVRIVDDGLEPAMLERSSPQLHLVSTAHRRATSLMLSRIATATTELTDPQSTLLMLWGAPPDADIADRDAWRLASAHWSPGRAQMLERVYRRALAGETDEPDPEEPDPLEAFRSQYLNIWPNRRRARVPGAVEEQVWVGQQVSTWPGGTPVVAVECALNGSGFAVARAVRHGDAVTVEAVALASLAAVKERVNTWRSDAEPVWVGRSVIGLMEASWTARPLSQDQFAGATALFMDAYRGGRIQHLPAVDLDDQIVMMQLRGIGHGGVLTSTEPVHVARSAVWAVWAALSRKQTTFVV